MKLIVFLSSIAFSVSAFALKSDGKVQADWQHKNGLLTLTVHVADGFHVNEKAPAQLQIFPSQKTIPPQKLEAKKAVFSSPGKISSADKFVASLYVCDDALTVCEPREWTWSLSGEKGNETSVVQKTSAADVLMMKAQKDCAHRKNGHLLLNFSARWCPGCLRLKQEVWNQPEVKKTLKEFEVVMMDADVYSSKPWMKKYEVRGIPATLVLNCKGEEIDRVVDFLSAPAMKKTLTDFAQPGVPGKAELMKRAEQGDGKAAIHLGRRASWSYKNEDALKWFEKSPASEREKYFEYWNALLATKRDLPTTERALAALPNTMSSLSWLEELAELQGVKTPEGQKTLQRLVAQIDALIADPDKMKKMVESEPPGEAEGFETLHIYQSRAEALDALERKEEARAAWTDAVKEGDRLKIKDSVSGPYFRFISVLKKAGENERVRKFFEKNTRGAKPNGDLARRYANFLYDQGDFKKSLLMAEKAMKDSYDQNQVFSAMIYAKALVKNGRAGEARKTLLRFDSLSELDESTREEIKKQLDLIR